MKIELKNGSLVVSKPLICEDEKKVRLHFLLTVGKDFANEFYLSMHHANSQIQQLQFFWKIKLKFFWKSLYKRFEFNLVCTEFHNSKDFLRLYSQFENKKSKNENLFAMLSFFSALLSYIFSFEAKMLFVNRCIWAF